MPQMPTEEKLRAASRSWYEPLKPCLYTNWPKPYKQASFRTESLVLSEDDQANLRLIFEGGDAIEAIGGTTLPAKLSRCLASFPDGAFVKLESRSPKDNHWGEETRFRTCSWRDIAPGFYSERIMDDLCRYRHLDEPCRMLFREWRIISKHEEFRCFIKAGAVAGISQYFYSHWDESAGEQTPLYLPRVAAGREQIKRGVLGFLTGTILPHLPVEDLVVDVWLSRMDGPRLIETNPCGLSDPCLFTYPELEGAVEDFRYVGQAKSQATDSKSD